MLCPNCASPNAIRNGSGRAFCRDCKTYPRINAEQRAELAQEAIMARQGHAPDHDMTRTTPAGFMVKGVSTLYDKDGKIAAQWVKTDQDREQMLAVMDLVVRALIEDLPRVEPRTIKGRNWIKNCAAAYPIGDPHIGMYSWAEETGEDWDLAIAERMHCAAMSALVDSAPATEKAYIVNLGDLFHYDSMEPKTSRSGHVLDADSRYAKMVRVGVKVMRQCIESALTKHKLVHVVNVKGNHDDVGALWLSEALHQIYERESRVTIDTSPSVFNYFRVGKTLIGMHHGNTCKPQALAGVMAADRAKDWGECEHRYWWVGHVHHQNVYEFPGVSVETFGTLAAKDAYAAAGGWRARRNMKCIVLHEEHGEVARFTVNPAMLDAPAKAA